jgi:hypothetical protein
LNRLKTSIIIPLAKFWSVPERASQIARPAAASAATNESVFTHNTPAALTNTNIFNIQAIRLLKKLSTIGSIFLIRITFAIMSCSPFTILNQTITIKIAKNILGI